MVRIWLERREIPNALPEWRGVIEHVASGKQRYILDLDTIVIFMAEYMHEWGVEPKSWVLTRRKYRHLLGPERPLRALQRMWQGLRGRMRGDQGA